MCRKSPKRCCNYHYGKCIYGSRCYYRHTTPIFKEPEEIAAIVSYSPYQSFPDHVYTMITYDFRSFAQRSGNIIPFTIGDFTFQKFPDKTKDEIIKRSNYYFNMVKIGAKRIWLIKNLIIHDIMNIIQQKIVRLTIADFHKIPKHITKIACCGN